MAGVFENVSNLYLQGVSVKTIYQERKHKNNTVRLKSQLEKKASENEWILSV